MDEKEIKLRLVESAAQLPCIRALSDWKEVCNKTHAVVDLWYNNIVNAENQKAQPGTAPSKKGFSAKK